MAYNGLAMCRCEVRAMDIQPLLADEVNCKLNIMKYNHDREVQDFQEQIDIIRNAGFKPIAVSQMYLEDTFVFEKSDEANKAYKQLEDCDDTKVLGWWYGKEDFEKAVKEYETENNGYSKVRVHWLDV